MKLIFIFLILITRMCFASEGDFFLEQAKIKDKDFSENKYEEIIGGSIAFVVGNVGFFTTDSTPLRLAYSLIQTVGIINISDGVFNLYNPSRDKYYYAMLKKFPNFKEKGKNITYISRNLIAINAKNDKAIRLARFYRSSLLSAQYFINTIDSKTSSDLRNIYYFMAGINTITAIYSYFSRSEYEKFYENSRPNKISWGPAFIPQGGALVLTTQF